MALFILLLLVLQIPQVQTYLAGKAASYLENKTGATVEVEALTIRFPKSVVLEGLYIEDEQKDTLLYTGSLSADIGMWGLFSREINLNSVELENATAHIERTLPDSAFNFDFILKSFSPDTSAQNVKPQEDTTKPGWEIALYELNLENIFFTFRDEVSGMDVQNRLGSLHVDLDKFDLENNSYFADNIELKNNSARVIQRKAPPESTEDTSSMDLDIGLGSLSLENIDVVYKNLPDSQDIKLALGKLQVEADDIDLKNKVIALEKVSLTETSAALSMYNAATADTATTSPKASKSLAESLPRWNVKLGDLEVRISSFAYDNKAATVQERGIDFNHIKADSLVIDAENLSYRPVNITANLKQLSVKEQSGFKLQQFQARLRVDSTHAELTDLNIETGRSRIRRHIEADYRSIDQFQKNIGEVAVAVNLENTIINTADILYFQPSLASQPPFADNPAMSIRLSGQAQGKVNDLELQGFSAAVLNNTAVKASGRIAGLPDIERTYFNLDIPYLTTSRSDLYDLLPSGSIPPSINVPNNVRIHADFKGYISDFNTRAFIATSLGNVTTVAHLKMPEYGLPSYTASVSTDKFRAGTLLKQDSLLGTVAFDLEVEGRGFDPDTMQADIDLAMHSAEVLDYTYRQLDVEGRFEKMAFTGTAEMNDSNLMFTYNGTAGFGEEVPRYDFKFQLEGADLKALNFSKDDFKVKGNIVADLSGSNLNNINGDAAINDVYIIKNNKEYRIHNLAFVSIAEERNTQIDIRSDFLDAKFKGTINLGDLGPTIMQHMDRYFEVHEMEEPEKTLPQNFSFEIKLKNPDLLADIFVPKLEKVIPGEIHGEYSSESKNMDIDVNLHKLVYDGVDLDSLKIRIDSDPQKLNYSLALSTVQVSDVVIEDPHFHGKIQDDSIRFALEVIEGSKQEFLLAGGLRSLDSSYRFSFDPDGVVFSFEPWKVAPDNYLLVGKDRIIANNLQLSHEGSSVRVHSTQRNTDRPPLKIEFSNFSLATLTDVMQEEGSLMAGVIDGNVVLQDLTGALAFTADLDIREFAFKNKPVGNLQVEADNQTEGRYTASIVMSGNGNDVKAGGYYLHGDTTNRYNFDVDVNTLNLASLQPFLSSNLTDLSGSMNGQMKLRGPSSAPEIRGRLKFDEATFRPTALGSYFRLGNESLVFNEKGIRFPSFTLSDSAGNPATLNGYIYTEQYQEFRFDLDFNISNFTALNSPADRDKLFYGKMIVSASGSIAGDMAQPVVDVNTVIEEGTDFTIVTPRSEPGIEEREGVVEFVDMDSSTERQIVVKTGSEDTVKAELRGVEVTANISADKQAQLNILIDPEAGDMLKVRGEGNLSLGVNESGDLSLTGRYEIAEGSYRLSFYNFVRRTFEIEPGSSITWLGDPLTANVDITATYRTKAAPIDLLEGQLSGTAQEINRFKQQIPFLVNLSMEGDLKSPELTMDIQLPPDQQGVFNGMVANKLYLLREEPSQMNKQVFALLVLGRFLPEDPLAASGGGGGTSTFVASSVSRLLTQQLNRLASKYITDVQIDFNVESYEDYSTGEGQERTDLNVQLSKNFLNDRLTVKVGGDVNIQGEEQPAVDQAETNNTSEIVSDITVEYKLTKDGRLRILFFRNNEYAGVIQGQVVETGTGLIFVRDFNRFKEVFTKPEEKEQFREEPKTESQ